MSGRQHHYLPQFLQRPFAHRQKGRQFYVHAHHRTRGPFTPNTKGLGQEQDFYGGPEDSALDDAITDGETALAATLRSLNEGQEVSPMDAATLICALGFRTKSTREALVQLFPSLIMALRMRFADRTRFRQELMDSLQNPKEINRLISEELDKHGRMPREQRARAAAMLRRAWKPHVDEQGEKIVSEVIAMAHAFLSKAYSEADVVGRRAYIDALSKDPHMPVRAQKLVEALTFSVLEASPGEYFILGDCGPVALLTSGKPGLVLGSFADDVHIQAVYLPISPTRCLVGQSSVSDELRISDINHMSAALSLEFFVSHRAGPELDTLRSAIGTLSPVDSPEELIRSLIEGE